jgi:hypothetical protein
MKGLNVVLASCVWLLGCGESSEAVDDGHDTVDGADGDAEGGYFLDPPPLDAQFVYRLHRGAEQTDIPASVTGTETIDGREYLALEMIDRTTANPGGVAIWVELVPGVELRIKRIDAYYADEDNGGEPAFSYLFDTPLVLYVSPEPGRERTSAVTGVMTYPWGESPVEVEAVEELLDLDETVEVPYGTVDGCWHFHLDVRETVGGEPPIAVAVDYWAKPHLGFVKTTMVPGFDSVELVSISPPP